MSHFVYILRCCDGSLYTGYTTDVSRRVAEHNGDGGAVKNRAAGARYTRARRPVFLVHTEVCESRSAALKREATIKKMTKAEKEALLLD